MNLVASSSLNHEMLVYTWLLDHNTAVCTHCAHHLMYEPKSYDYQNSQMWFNKCCPLLGELSQSIGQHCSSRATFWHTSPNSRQHLYSIIILQVAFDARNCSFSSSNIPNGTNLLLTSLTPPITQPQASNVLRINKYRCNCHTEAIEHSSIIDSTAETHVHN